MQWAWCFTGLTAAVQACISPRFGPEPGRCICLASHGNADLVFRKCYLLQDVSKIRLKFEKSSTYQAIEHGVGRDTWKFSVITILRVDLELFEIRGMRGSKEVSGQGSVSTKQEAKGGGPCSCPVRTAYLNNSSRRFASNNSSGIPADAQRRARK